MNTKPKSYCVIDGCDKQVRSSGLCQTHHKRLRVHGDPLGGRHNRTGGSSIRVEGALAYVELTQGFESVIDAEDVPLVSGIAWAAQRSTYTHYARSPRGVYMHSLILPVEAPFTVDHISRDALDNRKVNLRKADWSMQAANRRSPTHI